MIRFSIEIDTKTGIIILVLIAVLVVLFGYGIKIPIGQTTIELVPPKSELEISGGALPTAQIPIVSEVHDIVIRNLSIDQKIYAPNDTSTIEFTIENGLNTPYNISVFWYHNNTRYPSWSTISTKHFPINTRFNDYYSLITVYGKGEWEVQVIINYTRDNRIISKDAIDKFRVI